MLWRTKNSSPEGFGVLANQDTWGGDSLQPEVTRQEASRGRGGLNRVLQGVKECTGGVSLGRGALPVIVDC